MNQQVANAAPYVRDGVGDRHGIHSQTCQLRDIVVCVAEVERIPILHRVVDAPRIHDIHVVFSDVPEEGFREVVELLVHFPLSCDSRSDCHVVRESLK